MDSIDNKQYFDEIINNIKQIPTLPNIITRILATLNNPESSAQDAADIISKDPALASKMLRLANSAFYGIPRTISSINNAIVVLGFNTIKALVLSASAIMLFPQDKEKSAFDRTNFWRHSIACGIAARVTALSCAETVTIDPETAFCAGLLHDIGKIILEQFAHEDFLKTVNVARKQSIPLYKAEQKVLGTDHAYIGGLLADKWNLPPVIKFPLMYHHDPEQTEAVEGLTAIINIADHLCHAAGFSLWDQEAHSQQNKAAHTLVRLPEAETEKALNKFNCEIKNAGEFFSIIST
jgi:putative nucleotidyltransferase with HDIG domain